jgi:hypothetical protein
MTAMVIGPLGAVDDHLGCYGVCMTRGISLPVDHVFIPSISFFLVCCLNLFGWGRDGLIVMGEDHRYPEALQADLSMQVPGWKFFKQ